MLHWRGWEILRQACTACNTWNSTTPWSCALLQSVQAGYLMQLAAMDIVGPVPERESASKDILVVSDYFTKWAEAYGIANQKAYSTP